VLDAEWLYLVSGAETRGLEPSRAYVVRAACAVVSTLLGVVLAGVFRSTLCRRRSSLVLLAGKISTRADREHPSAQLVVYQPYAGQLWIFISRSRVRRFSVPLVDQRARVRRSCATGSPVA